MTFFSFDTVRAGAGENSCISKIALHWREQENRRSLDCTLKLFVAPKCGHNEFGSSARDDILLF